MPALPRPISRPLVLLLGLATLASAPVHADYNEPALADTIQYVGLSGVSAQQMFLGAPGKVYIVDKTERNNATVANMATGAVHPAWATEYDLGTNTYRTMDIISNSFCAGGSVLGNGTWLNVGGNSVVTYGGQNPVPITAASPYGDLDGGKALRLLNPSDDGSAEWLDDPALYLSTRRWYPTLETLEDGSIIIIGGCENGGYVNQASYVENNPTYEFFPSRGVPTTLNFLLRTLPVNLFPLTFLLPSGNLLIQAEFQAVIFDYKNSIEYTIGDIPDAVRVYPASGGTAVLPMTPQNNWTSTVLFCGGTDLNADQWTTTWNIAGYAASTSCVYISPDVDLNWYHTDALGVGRSMGQFINLPDGRLYYLNGAANGTAGYGNDSWAIGQSYADTPQLQGMYYDHSQPAGSRWSQGAVSSIPRMYHSSATLLADGSILVSGSNPNSDYVDAAIGASLGGSYKYFTQYQVEIFYPDYWGKTRPNPASMPTTITYGGNYQSVDLSLEDLDNNPLNINFTKAVIIRTGFSTHTMNMGQRHVELETAFTSHSDGSATLYISQLPQNPAILTPGPALLFVVVNGVPSNASFIMVGDGIIGEQTMNPIQELPESTLSAQFVAQYGNILYDTTLATTSGAIPTGHWRTETVISLAGLVSFVLACLR